MHITSLPCHGEQVNEALSYCVRSSTAQVFIVVYQNLFYQEPVTDNHIELAPHIEPVGDSKVYILLQSCIRSTNPKKDPYFFCPSAIKLFIFCNRKKTLIVHARDEQ